MIETSKSITSKSMTKESKIQSIDAQVHPSEHSTLSDFFRPQLSRLTGNKTFEEVKTNLQSQLESRVKTQVSTLTNNKTFEEIKDDLVQSQLAVLADNETFQEIKASLEEDFKTVKIIPPAFNKEFYETVFLFVLKKLDELIAIDIPRDILAEALSRHESLQEYLNAEEYPPDRLFRVVLMLEQTIQANYEPSFKPVAEIFGKKIELDEFVFPIALEILLKAGEIGILDGKIINLSLGYCAIKGSIKCKYGKGLERTILENHDEPLEHNQIYTFKEGVPIKIIQDITKSVNSVHSKIEYEAEFGSEDLNSLRSEAKSKI
jgi:hypothetical protein